MDYQKGGDLMQKLLKIDHFEIEQCRGLMRQMLLVIDLLHLMGIIHRDLKPQNILLVDDTDNNNIEIKVADFGLSQFTNDQERTKRLCGSPGYVAPEILNGKGCDQKSDIFSMGAIFYNLMTGRALFPGKSVD